MKKIKLGLLKGSTLYALMLLAATESKAATLTWDGPTSGTASWGDAVNWTTNTVPTAADSVIIGPAATTTISLDASRTVNVLTFSNANTGYVLGTAADNSAGYTLTVNSIRRETTAGSAQTIVANVNMALADTNWDIHQGFNNHLLVRGSISGTNLIKYNTGTLMLSGSNAYTGATVIRNGLVELNFNDTGAPSSNILNSAGTLTLGGGTLRTAGKSGASVSQTVASTLLEAGNSNLTIVNGNTANTRSQVNLGAISRSTGTTVNFTQPTGTGNSTVAANNGYTTSTANDASGILGGWATVTTGTTIDWATNNGTNIVAYTGYANLAGADPVLANDPGSNIGITAGSTGNIGQGAGTTSINTLRTSDAAAREITIGNGNTLRLGGTGGILAVGGALTIGASGNAGSITAGGADNLPGELVLNNTAAVGVNSAIVDNGTGSVAFTKNGSGTATLNSATTYSGGTTVNAGILQLTAGADRLLTTGNITVNGGTLNLGGSTQGLSGNLITNGGTLTNGTITKSGSDYDIRGGTISAVLAGGVGLTKTTGSVASLSANNTYTGVTTVLEGRLNATVAGATKGNIVVGSSSGVVDATFFGSDVDAVANTASVTVHQNGFFQLGNGDNMSNLTILGGRTNSNLGYINGTIAMTGGSLSGAVYGNHSAININASADTAVISAGLQGGAGTRTFTVADGTAATDLLLTGTVAGNGGLAKSGAGTMASRGAKSYIGVTTINAGVLEVDILANGGTNSSVGASTSGAGNLILRDGSTLRYTGTGHSTDRLFTVGNNGVGHSAAIEASGSGALIFTNTGNVGWSSSTGSQTRTLKLAGTSTADNSIASTINNNGASLVSVEKNGTGRWILTGANGYTGTTTVNGGTLLVNGLLANSAVTVNGGIFGGTGSVAGSVSVASGGTLSPGASIESLSTGAVSLAGGSTLTLEIDTTAEAADLLAITGGFSIDSGAILSLSDLGGNQPLALGTELTLATYTGAWNGGLFTYNGSTLSDDSVFGLGSNFYLANYDDSGAFTLTVTVPEPSAPALIAASLLTGCFLRNRGKTSRRRSLPVQG